MNLTLIDDETVNEIKTLVDGFILRYGPRLAGTKSCLEAASELKEHLGAVCDRAWLQSFKMHPDSFWSIPIITATAFGLSGLIYLLGIDSLFSLLLLLTGFLFALIHFIFLGKLLDPIFPVRQGMNVIAIKEPAREIKKQIVICAHHDSALRCRFLERWQILYPFRMIPAMFFYILMTMVLGLMQLPFPGIHTTVKPMIVILFLSGSLFVLPFFFFYRRKGTPGAGDNMLGSVLLCKMASILCQSQHALESARLIFVSHDGEEVGMRGAEAFLRENKELLNSYPLAVINVDSLHNYRDLTLLSSDRNGTVKLSVSLNTALAELWNKMGHSVRIRPLPPGGGGTDAAVYAAAGLRSVSLVGISTDFIRRDLVYHTKWDDVSHLDDRIIKAALDMILSAVLAYDQGTLDP